MINQLRLLNRAFRDRVRLEGADITMAQMSLLRALEDQGPMRPVDLAHRTGLSASTITGLVDHLEADRLVLRLRRQEDRREVEVRLSDRGEAMLSDLHGSVFTSLAELFSPLSDAEIVELETIFAKLVRR